MVWLVLSLAAGLLGVSAALVLAVRCQLISWESCSPLPAACRVNYRLGEGNIPSRAGAPSLCQPVQLRLGAGGHFWQRFLPLEQIQFVYLHAFCLLNENMSSSKDR